MQSRRSRYSYILRAIGQSLEEKQIVDFDLIMTGRSCVVHSRRRRAPSKMREWWQGWWIHEPEGAFPLSFSPVDIEWLNYTGESQRRSLDQAPDFRRLSQMLRTVGAYVDLRRLQLLELRRRGDQLRMRLRDASGAERVEDHSIMSFAKYFNFLYLECRINQPAIEIEVNRPEQNTGRFNGAREWRLKSSEKSAREWVTKYLLRAISPKP